MSRHLKTIDDVIEEPRSGPTAEGLRINKLSSDA